MNKKRIYVRPTAEVFRVVCDQSILAGSTLGDKDPGDIGMENYSTNLFEESPFGE
ncbi:MAG: hypothetical protein NC388_00540 [Clostridium sp.]|nr:hypothetical protein [Clostridium sp.]